MTPALLAAEINTDPKGLGYTALRAQSNGPEAVANKLNELNTVPADTLFKSYVPVEDMLAEIVFTEYTAWTAAQKTNIEQLLRGAKIKTGSANMRATLAAIIPTGTSRTNMIALASRPCSRAQFLWGEFATVTQTDVAEALD